MVITTRISPLPVTMQGLNNKLADLILAVKIPATNSIFEKGQATDHSCSSCEHYKGESTTGVKVLYNGKGSYPKISSL
jgi:hypothetical protein